MEEEEFILSAFSAPLSLFNCAQCFPYNFEHEWAGGEAEVGPDLCLIIADNHSFSFIRSTNTD